MNWILLGGGLVTIGGIFFIFKKMGVNKGDLSKFKGKINQKKAKKLTPEEKAFYKGEILLPVDPKDLAEKNQLKESLDMIPSSYTREKLLSSIDSMKADFEEWNPEKRYNFEKSTMGIKEELYKN